MSDAIPFGMGLFMAGLTVGACLASVAKGKVAEAAWFGGLAAVMGMMAAVFLGRLLGWWA